MKIRETHQEELKSLDKETIERIYKTYQRKLCLYAQKIVGSEEDAEDIVQNFFINLLEERKSIHLESLEAYLFQGVHNKCLNHLKHIKVTRQYSELTLDMDDDSDWLQTHDNNDPLSELISKETMSKIESEIAALPPKCREILNLLRYEGLSRQEVADKLRISINTVDTHVKIAKAKLRKTVSNLRE